MASTAVITKKPSPQRRTTKDNHYQNGWKTVWNQAMSTFNQKSLWRNTQSNTTKEPFTPNKYSEAIKKSAAGLKGITLLKDAKTSQVFQQPTVKQQTSSNSGGQGSSSSGSGSSSSQSSSTQEDTKAQHCQILVLKEITIIIPIFIHEKTLVLRSKSNNQHIISKDLTKLLQLKHIQMALYIVILPQCQ